MNLLAIDPGNIESAWVIFDGSCPLAFAKEENAVIRGRLQVAGGFCGHPFDRLVIEQIGHYGKGMPAGKEVFDTCRIIGRLEQIAEQLNLRCTLVLRGIVKMHLCGSMRAKDGNIIQAVTDRLGPKGTKRNPGVTYGVSGDVWQALGLAITATEMQV